MTLRSQLLSLEGSGLIRLAATLPELEYLFRHALVQDAAYGSLVRLDRQRLHGAAADVLEQLYPDRLESPALAPILAEHAYEAGDAPRALNYFTVAGDAARQVHANAEAAMHYGRALELALDQNLPPDRIRTLYTRRGRSLELSGNYAAAHATYDEMLALAQRRADRRLELEALLCEATIRSTPTAVMDLALGHKLGLTALELAGELGDRPEEARSLWTLALASKYAGRQQEAVEYGERCVAIARALNLREQLAYVLNDLFECYMVIGRIDTSRAVLEEARGLWRELGNLPMMADNMTNVATLHALTGEFEQALALAEAAYQIGRQTGNLWGQSFSRWSMARTYFEWGEVAQAIAALREGIELGTAAGFTVVQVAARFELALQYAELGWVDVGLGLMGEAARIGHENVGPMVDLGLDLGLAHLHLVEGKLAEAEAALTRASWGTMVGDPLLTFLFISSQIKLALARGDVEHAASVAGNGLEQLRSLGLWTYFAEAAALEAQVQLAQGRLADARALLTEAREVAERIGARRQLWPVLAALRRLEGEAGDLKAAEALRQQAIQVVQDIADRIDVPELRASFMARPAVRELRRE